MSVSDNDSDWSDEADDDIEMKNGDDDDAMLNAHCLFCVHRDIDVESLFSHVIDVHDVAIKDVIVNLNLDFYSYFKFINYIRKTKPSPSEVNMLSLDRFSSDDFLKPILEDDLLLQYDIENLIPNKTDKHSSKISMKTKLDVAEERANLAEEFLERTIDDLNKCRKELNNLLLGGGVVKGKDTCRKPNGNVSLDLEDHEGYFSSYAHYGIHEEMLKDKVRTGSYQSFILDNTKLFKGTRVLDVGCGTSVLSMFAAQVGAKEVIGVDNSEVAYQAMDVVQENGLQHVIKIQKGRAEDLTIEGKVDIIVSEWMGYFLLFESMLDTVLFCRDNYLSETGCIYPDKCNISLLALDDSELYDSKVKYWDNVYGYKMSAMKRSVVQEPLISIVRPEKIISDPIVLKEFDLMKISVSDLEFEGDFNLRIRKDGVLSALVGYFDVGFERNAEHAVRFSTSPSDVPTHWKQTVFFLKEPLNVKVDDCVKGRLKCQKNKKDIRALDITVNIYVDDKVIYHQLYCMT